jgi:hypothetical protein
MKYPGQWKNFDKRLFQGAGIGWRDSEAGLPVKNPVPEWCNFIRDILSYYSPGPFPVAAGRQLHLCCLHPTILAVQQVQQPVGMYAQDNDQDGRNH